MQALRPSATGKARVNDSHQRRPVEGLSGFVWLDTKLNIPVDRATVEETKSAFDMPLVHGKEGETMSMLAKQKKKVGFKLLKVEKN